MDVDLGSSNFQADHVIFIWKSISNHKRSQITWPWSNLLQWSSHTFIQQSHNRLTKGIILLQKPQNCYFAIFANTLFSKRSAHENHPNFLRSLGHRPRPRVILILSIGLESQDHLTKLSPGELGEINVHFFWRRVYAISRCYDDFDRHWTALGIDPGSHELFKYRAVPFGI